MRCKNCGMENDDNLYICQNCGSPLYDEADINDEESTVEFKKISNDEPEDNSEPNNSSNNNNQDNKNDDDKKKQLTIIIIVLCVVLVAVIAGVIGAVIANNNKKDDELTETTQISTTDTVSTTSEYTTKPTTEQEETSEAPLPKFMVTVRATKGGSVDGGGQFEKDKEVKIVAKPNDGYNFLGWYTPNGVNVSQSLSYTFALKGDVVYEAKFEKIEVQTNPTTTETPNTNEEVNGGEQIG